MMAGDPTPYQPSAAEGRERLLTVGRWPADAGEAGAWLARLDQEAAGIRAQLAAAAGDDDWHQRAGRALAVKTGEIARLEGWLLRHAPATLGTLADAGGVRPVTAADLDRWEAAAFEGAGEG